MHPLASETNLIRSIGQYLFQGLPTYTVVNADEYDALTEELSRLDTFTVFQALDGTSGNKARRFLRVACITRRDPGNIRALALFDKIKALFIPGLSMPFLDFSVTPAALISHALIYTAAPKPFVPEADGRKSKALAVELVYPQLY
jgi:hypothetical protein